MQRTQSRNHISVYTQVLQTSSNNIRKSIVHDAQESDDKLNGDQGTRGTVKEQKGEEVRISSGNWKNNKENCVKKSRVKVEFRDENKSNGKRKLEIIKKQEHSDRMTGLNPEQFQNWSSCSSIDSRRNQDSIETISKNRTHQQWNADKSLLTIQTDLGWIEFQHPKQPACTYWLKLGYHRLNCEINYAEISEKDITIGQISGIDQSRTANFSLIEGVDYQVVKFGHYSRSSEGCGNGELSKMPVKVKQLEQYCEWVKNKMLHYIQHQYCSQSSQISQVQKISQFDSSYTSSSISPWEQKIEEENKFTINYIFYDGRLGAELTICTNNSAEVCMFEWQNGNKSILGTCCVESAEIMLEHETRQQVVGKVGTNIYEGIVKAYCKYWYQNVSDL